MIHIAAKLIKTARSGQALLAFGHTYNRRSNSKNMTSRWYYSLYHSGCRAAIITNTDLFITDVIGTHQHQTPKFYRGPDGWYHKLLSN